jgi:hypothetical protein
LIAVLSSREYLCGKIGSSASKCLLRRTIVNDDFFSNVKRLALLPGVGFAVKNERAELGGKDGC